MREWDEGREVLDSVGDSNAVCFGNITGDAAVVFWSWSRVPGICSSWCPRGTMTGFVVDHAFGAGRGEWGLVETVNSKRVVMDGQFGVATARAQEVQG